MLAAGWAWWASIPPTPEVREEDNALPVVWYAEGDLHLAKVVVTLPGVDEFVAVGPDVAARMRSGEVVRIAADGGVEELAEAPPELTDVVPGPAYEPPGRYDVSLQSAPLPGGGWAYLIDSSRRDGAGRRTPVRVGSPRAGGVPHPVDVRRARHHRRCGRIDPAAVTGPSGSGAVRLRC